MWFLLGIPVLIWFYKLFSSKKIHNLNDEHCLITGGSSGIGLALAVLAAKRGANVSIVARSKERLEAAKEKIMSELKDKNQKVAIYSEDLSKADNTLGDLLKEVEDVAGPVTVLVNCAGTSVSHRFEDTSFNHFKGMMDVNFFGSINMTKAVLPLMKDRKRGRIVFVSSLAGLLGLYGYTAYSSSKFALRGLAEALQMEVKPFNISITVSYPPDTDTPGFAEELKTKPIETAKISESGGLYTAEQVAEKILRDTMNNSFVSSVGFEGWMLATVCSGVSPVNSLLDLVLQITTMGILRIAMFIYLKQCDHIVKKCQKGDFEKSKSS